MLAAPNQGKYIKISTTEQAYHCGLQSIAAATVIHNNFIT